MSFFTPTTVLVGVLLLYVSSFILFAIVRIATGVSIQRIGYFSLRRIAYAPREGVQIDIRGLGLSLHRPSFSQPTWISLRLTDLKVTVDPKLLKHGNNDSHGKGASRPASSNGSPAMPQDATFGTPKSSSRRSETWKRLTRLKERIKRLHTYIHWLAMIDVHATNAAVHFVDAGHIQVGAFTMAVDTRRKMVERGRLFRHKKPQSQGSRPAEWIMTVRNILLAVDGREPMELLDNLQLNIHGHLYQDLEGLRDTSVAIKIGRLHVPYDDLMLLSQRVGQAQKMPFKVESPTETDDEISFADFVQELDKPGSREDVIVQTVADSKEFASSILRGIEEIQVALSFFRVSRCIPATAAEQKDMQLNLVTHEIGIDLHRMDPNSPAHRMYFQKRDVAHQALLAAISVSVSLEDTSGATDRLLYVPMATTTIKTTLPSKTVSFSDERDAEARNSNVLFANLVITSPSLDLEPRHVSQVLRLAQTRTTSPRRKKRDNHHIISRLLPKASIKLSVHEPVLRFVLPIPKDASVDAGDYNLLISSISSISLDIESSHSAEAGIDYSLSSVYRVASHQLYYQTPAGAKHNLLQTKNMEVRVHLNATPEVCVFVSGSLNSFSVHMVNADVNRGMKQVVEQFRAQLRPRRGVPSTASDQKSSFLRRLPPWLMRVQFEATELNFEVAGPPPGSSKTPRGVALQLESWTADYRAQKLEPMKNVSRRRTSSHSHSSISDDPAFRFPPTSPPRRTANSHADGRRLAVHIRGLEGFVIEAEDYMEPESFLSLPRCEVAFSSQSDLQGPIFHINSTMKALYLEFSLYRIYSLGVAANVLHETFVRAPVDKASSDYQFKSFSRASLPTPVPPSQRSELTTVDLRVGLVQVKAVMPDDPRLMLQIYGLAAGSHRWSAPFLRCHLARLHVAAPRMKGVWARVLSMNTVRVDLRESKKLQGREIKDERSIDVSADFIRLGVPHHLIMHRVFNNFINTFKALKALRHRFKTDSDEDVLHKDPEGPKIVPRISLRSKALAFQLEDDAFEWRLGCIYRAGLVEQRHRLAREEAFRIKAQKVKDAENKRNPSRYRAHSAHPDSHRGRRSEDRRRSASIDPRESRRPVDKDAKYGRARYDTDGAASITSTAKVSETEAWRRLQEYNARDWKSKIDAAMQFQAKSISQLRTLFAGADEPPEDAEDDEPILAIPNRPALMSTLISDVHLVIDKPSFPVAEYPKFLHRIGKGMPVGMEYSLLIPMSLQLDMGEARVTLRDYPLDLLHIPALRPGQSPRLPSWSLKTDFVIAEEYRNYESTRDVRVCIVPAAKSSDGQITEGVYVNIRRTVAPVKTYSEPNFDINTSLPTSFTWCMSYQPVIQDMMKIIEGFTKPEVDPSERVGFWDKIRLSFHSRIKVRWKGDGDVHLRMKGSRDPYIITGFGAGFVMCWRKDVQWYIHPSDDPKEFMTVTSGEYVLAVPDYSHEARYLFEYALDEAKLPASYSAKNAAQFKKVLMKLSGSVKWLAGLVFERDVGKERSFDFKPHYDVVLKNPHYIEGSQLKNYDAFRGFRSNHIHLSVAVMAPTIADQTHQNYNTVHLTPRIFTHFFNWWSLFSGVMSLPVRQGPLWPGITKASKKFGRHLATVKYKLLLSPLFVSHIYKHKEPEDYGEDVVTATGLKVRLSNFKFDIHQRREQVTTPIKGRLKQLKSSAMRINRAELDFEAADFRAVSASIEGTTIEEVEARPEEIVVSLQQPTTSVDLSRFTIPDRDFSWIDMDDFVELDWILPQESTPKTQILPLAYTPRFTYFRQTDHSNVSPANTGFSPFGDEPTHECVMSQGNDPRRVQMDLIKGRIANLEVQAENHELQLSEHELQLVRDGVENNDLKVKHELLVRQAESLDRRRKFLLAGLRHLEKLIFGEENQNDSTSEAQGSDRSSRSGENLESNSDSAESIMDGNYEPPDVELATDFNNRFTIHNPQVKWNNSLRDIMVRYGHQVSQRRGFVYYMSRQAVKFISDIVDEQNKNNRKRKGFFNRSPNHESDQERDDDDGVEERIEQLLHDAKRFVNADDHLSAASNEHGRPRSGDFTDNISSDFTPQNSYHLHLIAPQIQLQSDKNPRSVTLIAAKGMTLKVISIMDKRRVSDDVSGLVQRRFSLRMDGAQFFVATQKNLKAHLQFYAGNKYGNAPGSAWPPWLTLEAMFDFELNPFGFSRIIQRTSASLRYDKYNNLRLKYNDEVAKSDGETTPHHDSDEGRVDQIWVDFPDVRAICDSNEYYTMYIIVLDLLLYNEPLEKVRSEKLEKIMFASDFSDLRGAPEMVFKLQDRIRQLEEIRDYFQVQAQHLDVQGWQDRITLEKDLVSCEDELFFIMKAITTSQRRTDERALSKASASLRYCLSASDIVWHLMRDKNEPLVEFQLRNASYERTDHTDGSNHNMIEIERLYALNLLENAIYPQMIVPYMDHKSRIESGDIMFRVQWYMLEAVAGIPVLDQFEVNLFPLKVQLERELGQKLFEYIFPGAGSNAFENGGFSPFMVKHIKPLDEDDETEDMDGEVTPDFVSTPRSQGSTSTGEDTPASMGPGSIELRLQPTLSLPDNRKGQHALHLRSSRFKPMTRITKDKDRLSPGDRPGMSPRSSTAGGLSKKKSTESIRGLTRSSTDKSLGAMSGSSSTVNEPKKFSLVRGSKKQQTDDLTQMMSRASNYMILANVKINDVVLCLSYKGRGERNIEDVHDFVFRLPVLEYRNKTWSNLELALRLKKDVIKALISHAPAILGNKLAHPRPNKQQQQRLRELASSSQIMLPSSDTSSLNISASRNLTRRDSTTDVSGSSSLHKSVSSSGAYPLGPAVSYSSSNASSREPSIMVSEFQSTADTDSNFQQNDLVPRRSLTSERPSTSRSIGGNSHDDSSKKTIRNLGRKLLHRHTANTNE
ncbi:mitochondrial protein from FMP27-domain-containing protein [Talaromyces proteolyticus]|uniref:Mitochondrial protein from FMP27-domain-containing protein n=1 Tax=Talaromyces proteolyticus TaxID=1131652 RepID=A0AAD4L0G4_9EURO|nr:mitochondrial protein from FMP27-domain-containing protein [Talaromyces proteolyticus]KAH8705257.1 mitochondrial protein from FMP27-domain-containing protein [Talaromyces proteolyticus]